MLEALEAEDFRSSSVLHFLAANGSQSAHAMAQVLLQEGSDPNCRNCDGKTPVHIACAWGQYEMLKLLLLYGGDPELRAIDQRSAFDIANDENSSACLSLLKWWRGELLPASPSNTSSPRRQNSPGGFGRSEYYPKFFKSPITKNRILTPSGSPQCSSGIASRQSPKCLQSPAMVYPPKQAFCRNLAQIFEVSAAASSTNPLNLAHCDQFSDDLSVYSQDIARDVRHKQFFGEQQSISDTVRRQDACKYSACCEPLSSFVCLKPGSTKGGPSSSSPPYQVPLEKENRSPDAGFEEQVKQHAATLLPVKMPDHDEELANLLNATLMLFDEDAKRDVLETTVRSIINEERKGIPQKVLDQCRQLNDHELRANLVAYGMDVGPIMMRTRWLYENRLARWMHEGQLAKADGRKYSEELTSAIEGNLDVDMAKMDELAMTQFFDSPPRGPRLWREGNVKMSFCYLLLDPSTWTAHKVPTLAPFLDSIFYVGKGKKSRPYQHLLDTLTVQSSAGTPSAKGARILSIWQSGRGVVSLHFAHGIIPVEAYTREAAIIEALRLPNLTNQKRGDFYGLPTTWTMFRKRRLGAFLLLRAHALMALEGFRELKPCDLPNVEE